MVERGGGVVVAVAVGAHAAEVQPHAKPARESIVFRADFSRGPTFLPPVASRLLSRAYSLPAAIESTPCSVVPRR